MQRAYPTRGIRFLAVAFTIGIITAVASYQAAATDVFTDPVGFISVPVTNVSGGFNTMALPFQTMRNDAGALTAPATDLNATQAVITVNCSTCATANYALASSLNYVEFASGAAFGKRYTIKANTGTSTGTQITLQTDADNFATMNVTTGDKWVIHPYWRVQDVFGPAVGGSLFASNAAGRADNVLVWNGSGYTTYWPRNNGSWQGGGGGTDPLLADESMFVVRKLATQTNILALGEVRVTNFVSVLHSGFNMVGNSFPASTVVSNLNLIGTGSGFLGNSAAARSDQVLVWNGTGYDVLWFRTNAVPPAWQGGAGNAEKILPSSTYFINLQGTHHGNWSRPIPYTP